MKRVHCLALLVLSSSLGACVSLVSDGKVGDHDVNVDATGFAWLDATAYEDVEGELRLKSRPVDDTMLHLFFSSAPFDPARDLRELPPAERARVQEEIAAGDVLEVIVSRGDRVAPGDGLEYDGEASPAPGTAPFLSSVTLRLGAPPLAPDDGYPAEVTAPAQRVKAALDLHEVEPRVVGVLDVELERDGADDDGAEGQVTVRFDVERIGERIAECNYSPAGAGAGVDPCARLSVE